MTSKNRYQANGVFYTLYGATALYSNGTSSLGKGVAVDFFGETDLPDRINIRYVRAPGDGAMHYLDIKDMVDIRTCALNGAANQNTLRMTGKKGELYLLEMKTSTQAQELNNILQEIGKETLVLNRTLAEELMPPEQDASRVMLPKPHPSSGGAERKKKFYTYWESSCKQSDIYCFSAWLVRF